MNTSIIIVTIDITTLLPSPRFQTCTCNVLYFLNMKKIQGDGNESELIQISFVGAVGG